jgi:hypothetical protein
LAYEAKRYFVMSHGLQGYLKVPKEETKESNLAKLRKNLPNLRKQGVTPNELYHVGRSDGTDRMEAGN